MRRSSGHGNITLPGGGSATKALANVFGSWKEDPSLRGVVTNENDNIGVWREDDKVLIFLSVATLRLTKDQMIVVVEEHVLIVLLAWGIEGGGWAKGRWR